MRTLAIVLLVALAVVLLAPVAFAAPWTETGRATTFGHPGDRHAGGAARCIRRSISPVDMGIAHRTLPCGTRVLVRNQRTGAVMPATVMDRGPYGSCLDAGWRRGPCSTWNIKRRASDPGTWRGVADLTPALSIALGHRSFDRVTLTVLE